VSHAEPPESAGPESAGPESAGPENAGPEQLGRELAALAVEIAGQAAALLMEGLSHRSGDASVLRTDTKSSATDLVTDYDRASERLLFAALLTARPDDAIVGEEGTDHPGTSGVRWVLDPLDGTTNYVYGHPGFGVSVAAELEGVGVIAGAVADPMHQRTFHASLGGGAWCNGSPIRCSPVADLGQALVATGFSYEADRRRRQAQVLVSVLPAVRDLRRMGAAAVDLCAVACGQVDAFYERGLQPWDYAAGALIATEAGAKVTDLDGGPTSSDFTLAAPPGIFENLRAVLRQAGAGDA